MVLSQSSFHTSRASTPVHQPFLGSDEESNHWSISNDDIDMSRESSVPSSINLSQSESIDSQTFEESSMSPVASVVVANVDTSVIIADEPQTVSFPSLDTDIDNHALSLNSGYKLVFDNIDKNIKPRYMRSDSQTLSLHYVQMYGVKDRVDYSTYSSLKQTEANLYSILPGLNDYELIKNDFVVVVSRIIQDNLAFFGDDFKNLVVQHIPHKYSKEMSTKSEVVSSDN